MRAGRPERMDWRYAESDNEGRVVEFFAERGLYVGNKYFGHKCLHKCTRMARDQDGVKVKSMICLVLVKKDILRFA